MNYQCTQLPLMSSQFCRSAFQLEWSPSSDRNHTVSRCSSRELRIFFHAVPGPGRMQFLAVQDRRPCWLTGCQSRGHLNSLSHRLYIQANSSMLYRLVLPIFLASLLLPARENALLLKSSCNGPTWITFRSEAWDYNYIVPSWKHLVQNNPRTGLLRAS